MPLTALDSNSALVILDLQEGVAAYPMPVPMDQIVERANALSDAFRAKGLPVVLVVVDAVPPGRTDQPRHAMDLPPDFADIVPGLTQRPGDIRVTKKSAGAFATTDLEATLRDKGVTQVVLLGVATGTAVESTARQAYEQGFNVTVVLDAITDPKDEAHRHSVEKVFPRLAETGDTADVLRVLEEMA